MHRTKARPGFDTKSVQPYFCVVKNVTITMPDDLARKTRVLAAEADTSMSQYLCQLVAAKVANDDCYAAGMKRYLSRRRGGLRLSGQGMPSHDEIHDRHALR